MHNNRLNFTSENKKDSLIYLLEENLHTKSNSFLMHNLKMLIVSSLG